MKRGDIVVVPFPFQDKPGEKIRPALVVQSDVENGRLVNTILAMITGNLDDSTQPTTVLVDPRTSDGAGSGLNGPSLVKCYNLATIRQRRVLQVIGHLSNSLMSQVKLALKAALSPLGHSIVEAGSGIDALRCVMAEDFAVLRPSTM